MFELNKQLHQQLLVIDQNISNAGSACDDHLTRKYVDQRRQILAEYESTIIELIRRNAEEKLFYKPDPVLEEFVELWCEQLKVHEFVPFYLTDIEYCERFIDCYLPKSWNWATDFVLLISPFHKSIFYELRKRGQKKIIVLNPSKALMNFDELEEQFEEFWIIDSLKKLEEALYVYPYKVSNICHMDCLGTSTEEITSEKIQKIVKEGIYVRQININTMGSKGREWSNNHIRNLPKLANLKNVKTIGLQGTDAAIIVAPGPSLEKNIHLLKVRENNFFVICPLRAVPTLRANDIEPDFVIQMDSIGGKYFDNAMRNVSYPVKRLVLDSTVDPRFFEFKAEDIFWYMSTLKTMGSGKYLDTGHLGLEAESVALVCLKFAYQMGLKNIALVGQDLAFEDGKRYAKGASLNFMPRACKDADVVVDGYYGGKVTTSTDYEYFINSFNEMGEMLTENGCKIANCTEGGALIKSFPNKPLKDFLAETKLGKKKVNLRKHHDINPCSILKYLYSISKGVEEVGNLAEKARQIETSKHLSVKDVSRRDRFTKKMTKKADSNDVLYWAFQDLLNKAQNLSYYGEAVTSLEEFLEEVNEVTEELLYSIFTAKKELEKVISDDSGNRLSNA